MEALNSITNILRDDLILNKEYNKACEQPIITFFVRRSLLQGIVAFIVVINIILKAGLAYLVPQEKHYTRTESDKSLVDKVFVSQFINTALVALLVNTRISGFAERFGTSGSAKFLLFTDPYEDFSLPWYVDIGDNHVVTMISNAVQTFIPLVVIWPLQVIQETWATRNTATQIILNRQLIGAVFEVAARYGWGASEHRLFLHAVLSQHAIPQHRSFLDIFILVLGRPHLLAPSVSGAACIRHRSCEVRTARPYKIIGTSFLLQVCREVAAMGSHRPPPGRHVVFQRHHAARACL